MKKDDVVRNIEYKVMDLDDGRYVFVIIKQTHIGDEFGFDRHNFFEYEGVRIGSVSAIENNYPRNKKGRPIDFYLLGYLKTKNNILLTLNKEELEALTKTIDAYNKQARERAEKEEFNYKEWREPIIKTIKQYLDDPDYEGVSAACAFCVKVGFHESSRAELCKKCIWVKETGETCFDYGFNEFNTNERLKRLVEWLSKTDARYIK